MKNYLELIPLYAKAHRKQNRMSVLCIFLSVLLVTTIFGMADLYVQSLLLKTKQEDGNWHIMIKNISDADAELIAARPEVKVLSCYGTLNYQLDKGYQIAGKDVVICGSDASYLEEIFAGTISEGTFPTTGQEVLVSGNVQKELGLSIGSPVSIQNSDGTETSFTISGFSKDLPMILNKDIYGVFMNTAAYRTFYPNVTDGMPNDYGSCFVVQFHDHRTLRSTIDDIKTQFGLSDEQVSEQTLLLGLLGQSDEGNLFMMMIYTAAAILSSLVLLAGILMIAGSLNSNIAGRTQFFGMLRCVGATPGQIMCIVYREALSLCTFAIPVSIFCGMIIIWILCAVLRSLSPQYFSTMPVFAVSTPSITAGVLIGILTVLIASRTPAKRASKASPLAAVSGNACQPSPVRNAANTAFCRIETALGIHHAKESRRNLLLVSASFALSIILFLSFSTTVDFMKHAINALNPWTPDLSITASADDSAPCTLERSLLSALQELPAVKRAYGRMFAYNVPALTNGIEHTVILISYDAQQFEWSKKYLINGSLKELQTQTGTGLVVSSPEYNSQQQLHTGDTVALTLHGQTFELAVTGMVSECPFNTLAGNIILCSEDTFRQLTGEDAYTVIDLQLNRTASDSDLASIRALAGADCTVSDQRMNNQSVLGATYSYQLFLYGFLVLIALVTICNIVNCIAMSVEARIKQYRVLRAVGMSDGQLAKMITAETITYAVSGGTSGTILGLFLNKKLYEFLVTYRWNDPWKLPFGELCLILAIVAVSVLCAIYHPVKKIQKMRLI